MTTPVVTRDRLFEKIPENQSFMVLTNIVIPLILVYVVYLNGTRILVTTLAKYVVVLIALKMLYKYLRQEPDPIDKSKPRDTINVLYVFFIVTLLALVDKGVISFGNVSLMGTHLSLTKFVALMSVIGYGYLLIKVRSGYSTDLLTTCLLTFLIYNSRIFNETRGGFENSLPAMSASPLGVWSPPKPSIQPGSDAFTLS
jgi:hypothetical protein